METITQFFYNIVPGSLFIMGIYHIGIRNLEADISKLPQVLQPAEILSILLVLSLALGLAFQAFSKIPRYFVLKLALLIVEHQDGKSYEIANSMLKSKKLIENNCNDRQRIFFLIHDYLETTENSWRLARMFTTRTAFWSNMTVASFTLSFLTIVKDLNASAILMLVSFISLLIFSEYTRTQYDVILKTFITSKLTPDS